MFTVPKSEPSGHWYCAETGESRHTIIGSNGKSRSTTIRDAKKHGWLPSVTTILQRTLSKPELDLWKQKQVLMASLTLPRKEGESDEAFCGRVMEDAFEQVGAAADLGTRIHAAIENHVQGLGYDPELKPYVEAVQGWIEKNGVIFHEQERRIVCREDGWAGTADGIISAQGRPLYGVIDFKSRKSKPDYPMKPWATEPIQIACYCRGIRPEYSCLYGVNVFVSTTEPGRIEDAWYDAVQMAEEYACFKHINAVFQHMNKYTPPSVNSVLTQQENNLDSQ